MNRRLYCGVVELSVAERKRKETEAGEAKL